MKKMVVALGILVVLLVAVIVIAPFVVPTDVYTNRIAAFVRSSTGRDFKISGPVRLSLLPQLRLDVQDVALANAPASASPQMIAIKEVQLQLRLRPLLHGDVEIGRFVLIEPVIALEVDKQGHPNWVFATAQPNSAPAPAPAQPTAAGQGPTITSISLNDVQLERGKISYLDQRTGKAQEIDDINAKLALPNLDSPFGGNGSAVWNQQKVTLTVAVAKPRAVLLGGATPIKLTVDSDPVRFAFDGGLAGATSAKLDGAIDLAVPSVRALATWVGVPLAIGGTGFAALAIKGKIDAAGSKYAFTDASIALDAIKATGNLAVDVSGTRPNLQGQLAVERLDLNPYLPPEQPTPANASATAAQPIDLSPLKVADADFNLGTGALIYRKIQAGQSALALHLKDGKLAADVTQATLYGGHGKGSLMLDGSGEVPAIAANFDFAGLQMEPLLVAAAGTDKLAGTGTFTISATARGHNTDEMLRALDGKGSLNIANGALKGVNLIALAQNAVASLTQGASSGSETTFASLTATYTIGNGILHNNDLRLNSGLVPAEGAGTLNLVQGSVDYRITVRAARAVPVPIVVTGPFDNLSYRPDVGGAVLDLAKTPGALLQKVAPTAPTTPGGAGAAVGGLLNGLIRR